MPDREAPPITFRSLFADSRGMEEAFKLLSDPLVREANSKYRPWRKFRAIARDAGKDPVATWRVVKLARMTARRELPLKDSEGNRFGLCIFPSMDEQLHRIDQACGGGPVVAFESATGLLSDPEVRQRFIIKSMMEEAIESSRLEGAVTTRELAIELLRSGRPPKTPAEIMVANNYAAMQKVKGWLDRPLSSDMLRELQAILTRDTLKPSQVGRFRRADEPVGVVDERTGEVVFTPPPASGLESRIRAVCDFANDSHTQDRFIHPIVKACILHFLISYEHPFVDGNGRTARAVFFWYAIRSGYRVFEYLTISELIRAAYAKYPQAFIDTETDDADLTYFVSYKLGVISRSLERLADLLHQEEQNISKSLRLVRLDPDLNLRQRLLLEHALRHPKTDYTARSHARSNNVTEMTARTDLEFLRSRGFLNTYKAGRQVHYVMSPDLPARLADARDKK